MSLTLADTYYLKALNSYPYELEKVIESLNYAISYDNDHAGAHCLLGKLNMYQLGRYAEAENHFEKALCGDLNFTETYYYYIILLVHTGEYEKAKNIVKYAYNIRGINTSRLRYYEGLIDEIRGNYKKAKEHMEAAYAESYAQDERQFFKDELERVESKMKTGKKSVFK